MPHETEDCKEIFAMLSEYLDLELPPDACRQMEAHLAGCAPCVEFAESLRKTVALCHDFEAGEMPGPVTREARACLQDAWRRMVAARRPDPAG